MYNSGFDRHDDYLKSLDSKKRRSIIEEFGSENNFLLYGGMYVADLFGILDF